MRIVSTVLVLLALGVFSAISCKKKSDDKPNSDTLRYYVTIPDVTVKQYEYATVPVSVTGKYISGIREPLKTYITRLPYGVSVSPDSAILTPDATITFTLKCHVATEGGFPITVTTIGERSGTKNSTFNLFVKPSTCSYGLLGNYSEKSTRNADITIVTPRTIDPGSDSNHVLVKSFYADFDATLNCDANTFTIAETALPLQHLKVKGIGTFTQNQVIINWTTTTDFFPFLVDYYTDTWTKN